MTIASGVGSWPGSNAREAARIVVGELDVPHIVELPARGIGADMVGRSAALLVDLFLDTSVRGYRAAQRPSSVVRRAKSLLGEDLDALEEAWELAGLRGAGRTVKVQAVGPYTLAASLEFWNGHRVLTDVAAVLDFSQSLAEGVALHAAELARRLDAEVVVQLDEPLLPRVLEGSLRGVTAMDSVRKVTSSEFQQTYESVCSAIGRDVVVHCCGADAPLGLLAKSAVTGVSFDTSLVGEPQYDGVGEMVDAGKALWLGLVPTDGKVPANGNVPTDANVLTDAKRIVFREAADRGMELFDRIGLSKKLLAQSVVTPTCGLAGVTAPAARDAIRAAVDIAKAFADLG